VAQHVREVPEIPDPAQVLDALQADRNRLRVLVVGEVVDGEGVERETERAVVSVLSGDRERAGQRLFAPLVEAGLALDPPREREQTGAMHTRALAEGHQTSIDQFLRLAPSAPPRDLDGGVEAEPGDGEWIAQLLEGVERFPPELE